MSANYLSNSYREFLQKQEDERYEQMMARRDKLKKGIEKVKYKVYVRSRVLSPVRVKERDEWYAQLATERGYDSLSVSELVARSKAVAKAVEEKDTELDALFTRVYNDFYESLPDKDYAGRSARGVFTGHCPVEYKEIRALYDKLDDELLELQMDAGAYESCKKAYIKANEDLIKAERERARREELVSSGILEELGITPVKSNTAESSAKEETYSSAIHSIVNEKG